MNLKHLKNIRIKLLSVVCALVIVATGTALSEMTVFSEIFVEDSIGSVVTLDPGFESGNFGKGWENVLDSSAKIVSKNDSDKNSVLPCTGNYALMLGKDGEVSQNFTVKKGVSYELSFNRAQKDTETAILEVSVLGKNNTYINQQNSSCVKEYKNVKFTFTASKTEDVILKFKNLNFNDKSIYIDDASVTIGATISISNSVGGSISLQNDIAVPGEVVEIKVDCENGYSVSSNDITYKVGKESFELSSFGKYNNYSFVMPKKSVTLSAEFAKTKPMNLNLISNGEFNNSLSDSWTSFTGSTRTSGNASLNKSNNGFVSINRFTKGIYQDVQLEQGVVYQLSFEWTPSASSAKQTKLRVLADYLTETGDKAENCFDKTYMATNTFAFSTVSETFTATKTGKVRISFTRETIGGEKVYVDTISLKKAHVENNAAKKNLIKNGGFESGNTTDPWMIFWKASVEKSNSNHGEYAFSMDDWSGGVGQRVKVTKGVNYELRFAWNPNNAECERKIDVKIGESNNATILSKTFIAQSDKYQVFSYTFEAKETEELLIWFYRGDYDGKTFLDDISLSSKTDIGADYVSNGDFSDEFDDFSDWNDFVLYGENKWYLSENSALKDNGILLSNNLFGAFCVDSFSFARLSFNYFGENNSVAKVIVSDDSSFENVLLTKDLSGKNGSETVIDEIKTEHKTTLYIKFESINGKNYIDNVSLKRLVSLNLNTNFGGNASLDKYCGLPGETVTLSISDMAEGYKIAEGSPSYSLGSVSGSMDKLSDNQYSMKILDSDYTINLYFSAQIGVELLPDFGFESQKFSEDSKLGWQNTFSQSEFSNAAYEGKTSVATEPWAYLSLYYNNFYVEKGSTYCLSFIHKGSNINAGIYVYETWGTDYIEPLLTCDDDDWNRYSCVFTATKSTVLILAVKNEFSDEKAFFDNISCKKANPDNPDPDAWSSNYNPDKDYVPSDKEYIKDGSFESGNISLNNTNGWHFTFKNSVTVASLSRVGWSVYKGNLSLRLAAGCDHSVSQKIAVKQNTTYVVNFKCLADADGAGIGVGTSLTESYATRSNVGFFADVKSSEDYQSYSFVFNNIDNTELYITPINPSNGAAYFDCISVKEFDNRIVGDLGFRKTAKITVESKYHTSKILWSGAKSKLFPSDKLTYNIYCSKTPITNNNFSLLTPVATQKGSERREYSFDNLDDNTLYYYAIEALDPKGNSATILSSPSKTKVSPSTKLENGGFERGDTLYWDTLSPNAFYTLPGGASGNYCAELFGWCYFAYQPVVVEKNTEYVFSYDAVQSSGQMVFHLCKNEVGLPCSVYSKQVTESYNYVHYKGTYTTDDTTDLIYVSFYNGDDWHNAHVDNVYFKKIENKDLYFTSEPQQFASTKSAIAITWEEVVSKDSKENVTYTVYMSENQITEDNISSCKKIHSGKTSNGLIATAENLVLDKGYYFAVVAEDTIGNKTMEITSFPIYTSDILNNNESSDDYSYDDDDNNGNIKPITSVDDDDNHDDNNYQNTDDDNVDIIDDNSSVPKENNNTELTNTSIKTVKTTNVKPLWLKRIGGIALISVFAIAIVLLLILIFKFKKAKSLKIIIPLSVATVAAIFCGVWMIYTSTETLIKKTKIVNQIPVANTDLNHDNSSDNSNEQNDNSSQSGKDDIAIDIPSDNTSSESNEPIVPKGNIYYVSQSEGNDNNSGLSPEEPIKTLEKVNSLELKDADQVLFKRGDLWRGNILKCAKGYITYGAYGEGEKPTFYGSPENYAKASKWAETSYPNVYRLTDALGGVGSFSFNNDAETAFFLFTEPSKLNKNLQFCIDYSTGYNYLYCDKGNPGEVYNSIEAFTAVRMINVQTGNTVQDIKIKYCDYGIQCWTGEDINIRRMDISYIGGYGDPDTKIRAGNAIEFWSNLNNIVIEDNVIDNCYDTGITCQYAGTDDSDITMSNITIRNNKVSNCYWSTEFWIDLRGNGTGRFRNLKINNNTFINCGGTWSYDQRDKFNEPLYPYHLHLMAFTNYGNRDIIVNNNVFDGGKGGFIYSVANLSLPKMSGNTFIQSEGNPLGIINGKSYDFNNSASIIISLIDSNAKIIKK